MTVSKPDASFITRLTVVTASLSLSLLVAGCGGGSSLSTSPQTIGGLNTITTLSSTIDVANGDKDPRAIAIAPPASSTFVADHVSGHIQPDDVVVGNFSNSAGTMGAGTTIEDVTTGKPVNVFNDTGGLSGPSAFAFNTANGYLWASNLGLGTPTSNGGTQIVTPTSTQADLLTDPTVQYGWGEVYNGDYGGRNCFFTTNASTGQVVRINVIPGTNGGPATYTYDVISGSIGSTLSGYGGTAVGPIGLAHGTDDTLYIANGYNNTIFAIPNSTTATASNTLSNVILVYTDTNATYLDQPAGLAINPFNNDLIIANQKRNTIVELDPATKGIVGVKTVDPAIVDTSTGANSALFGIAVTNDGAGNLKVYFTDRNDNTVKVLSK